RRVRDDDSACLGGGYVDVVEPHAVVGEDPGAQRLDGERSGGDAVAHGGEERVGAAQRVLQLGRRERMVVPVQPGVEGPGQLGFDGRRQPAGHHDGRPTRCAHRATRTGRDGLRARAWATVDPSSAGLGATMRPADRMISAFSAAVSPNAEMIAPACPMRRPFGAGRPATYPITGLLMCSLTKRAATASCRPPISPIIMTTSVYVSSSNSPSRSTNELPLMASAANGAGTSTTEETAPVEETDAFTVLNPGRSRCLAPPLPGVTQPTTCVP